MLVGGDVVDTGHDASSGERLDQGARGIEGVRAAVTDQPGLDPEYPAIGADRCLEFDNLFLRVRCSSQILAPVLHPLDRSTEHLAEIGDDDFLGVDGHLLPEAAADFRRDHAHFVLGDVEEEREKESQHVRHLRGRVERQLSARTLVDRQTTACFHRRGDEAIRVEAPPEDAIGLRECSLDITERGDLLVHDVRAEILVQDRRIRCHRALGVRDSR